jgi:hypothetical protein
MSGPNATGVHSRCDVRHGVAGAVAGRFSAARRVAPPAAWPLPQAPGSTACPLGRPVLHGIKSTAATDRRANRSGSDAADGRDLVGRPVKPGRRVRGVGQPHAGRAGRARVAVPLIARRGHGSRASAACWRSRSVHCSRPPSRHLCGPRFCQTGPTVTAEAAPSLGPSARALTTQHAGTARVGIQGVGGCLAWHKRLVRRQLRCPGGRPGPGEPRTL